MLLTSYLYTPVSVSLSVCLLISLSVCVQKYGWTGANSYFTKADDDGLCFGAGRSVSRDILPFCFIAIIITTSLTLAAVRQRLHYCFMCTHFPSLSVGGPKNGLFLTVNNFGSK